MAVLLVKPPATSGAKIVEILSFTIFNFDVTTSEQHKHSVDWTKNPVETGLEVTDNAVVQPDELTLSGVISDTPLGLTVPLPDRAQSSYDTLLRLKDQKLLVTVVTGIKVYQDMGISGVTLQRDPKNGQAIRPTVTFRKIRIVNSVTIAIPPEILAPPVQPSGASEIDGGKQPTTDVGDVGSEAANATPEGDAANGFFDESIAVGLFDSL
jgi:hypothetical protein